MMFKSNNNHQCNLYGHYSNEPQTATLYYGAASTLVPLENYYLSNSQINLR